MREVAALVRAQWLTFSSYRLGVVLSLLALAATIVPVYFVAGALQPVVADSIQNEGRHYFGFLILGIATMYLVTPALVALPKAVTNGINSGTLEALFCTPTSVPRILGGLIGFEFCWAALRATIALALIQIVGVDIAWSHLPVAAVAVFLTVVAYLSVGLVAAALILMFRTAGPLVQGTLAVSSLLGGVYYSTTVIPEPFQFLAKVVPLTYGLRLSRRSLLDAAPLNSLTSDALFLMLLAGAMLVAGVMTFAIALRHARRFGTLGQY